VLRQHADVELVPSVTAWAMPGGVVARDAYERFKAGILDAAHDVDGVCLALHGAMRAEGLDYCEDDLLRDLRARVGPGVPITIALDMHANLIRDTMRHIDALVAYKTAPHDDTFETGQKAAQMLMQILKDGVRPAIGFAKIPFLLPGEMAQTSLNPMKAMMALVGRVERVPGVLSASLMNGHCWADVPDIGVIAVVVTDGDHALGEAVELPTQLWSQDQMQTGNADQHPRHQFAEDRRQAQPHHQLGQCPGGEEDHHEPPHLDQGLGRLELVTTGGKQQG